MFRVGQKVIQIKSWANPDTGYADVVFTVPGIVYTVRALLQVHGEDCIHVREVVNPEHIYKGWPGLIEQPFPARYFRPVIERKTDISIFTKMLKPKTRRVQERA